MFGFIKKTARGFGGIVKKATKTAGKVLKKATPFVIGGPVGGLIYAKRKEIMKGATWIYNRAKELVKKGMSQSEAEAQAAEEAKQLGPTGAAFPIWYVVAGAAALFLIVLIIVLTAPKGKA